MPYKLARSDASLGVASLITKMKRRRPGPTSLVKIRIKIANGYTFIAASLWLLAW
jgi:hypothetical protein